MNDGSARTAQRVEHLRMLGRYDEAERMARDALAGQPTDGLLLFALSTVLHQQGRYLEALRATRSALAELPEPQVYRQHALALSALDRHDDAGAASSVALSLDPNDVFSFIVHAAVMQRARSLDAAVKAARRAVELAPEEPAAHMVLAGVCADRGDRDGARAAYQEVLRLDSEHAAARHDLALLDLAQGRTGPALSGLLEAVALDPKVLGAGAGLPVMANVRAVLWRLSWYLRLVLFLSVFVVAATGPGRTWEPSTAARVAAAVLLAGAGLLIWRFGRTLPPQAGPVLRAAVRSEPLLATTAVLTAAGFAVYAAVVVTGYAVLVSAVFAVVVLLFLVTVAAEVRSRLRRRGRRRGAPG